MEEENDVLDWGAEDEESKNQDGGKNGAADARSAAGDNDDAEDAVSLGDEEESQEFYLYQQEEQNAPTLDAENSEVNVAPRSIGADDIPSTATLSGLQLEDSSQVSSSKTGTPRRNSSSRHSPQPTLAPRITHALPPKPVVTNVPFLPPSHPSIVEATAMSAPTRASGRSESQHSKVHGTSTSTVSTTGNGKGLTSGSELPPLPRGWEAREARSGSGGTYYYNVRTHESTWTRPVSNSSSSSPSRHLRGDSARRRRGSDSFLGTKSSSPRRSDNSHSQSQEPSRHSRRAQPLDNNHVTDPQTTAPTNATMMSYNDRHYRPGAGTDDTNASGNTNDRLHRNREDVDSRFNPRSDQAFTPSPEASPRARERPRSLSPLPMSSQVTSRGRDSRPTRPPRAARGGRNGNTDVDSTMYSRDPLLGSYPARDSWDQSNAYQESRRHSRHYHETPYDMPFNDRLPMLPRNGNARARREREPMREESQIMPDSRTRSPLPGKHDAHVRHNEPQDAQHWSIPQSREHEGHQTTSKSVGSLQLSAHLPPQRRRDRPSRFGQQPLPTILQPGLPSARLSPVELQTYPHRPMEEDDPFVPDDIRSPPPHELQQRREGPDEKSSLFKASVQTAEKSPSAPVYRQIRDSKQTDDDMENASSSEQRRARPPLPTQDAEFHEVSNRLRDRFGLMPPDRAPPEHLRIKFNQDGQPSVGFRDIQGPTRGTVSFGSRSRPVGQGRKYEENYREDSIGSAYRRQRNADMVPFTSDAQESLRKDVEYNVQMRRFPDAAQEEVEEMMVRESKYTGVEMGPPVDTRPEVEDKSTEPGYPLPLGQTFAPRGPRAMHSSVNQDEVSSPIIQGGFGPGLRGGNRDRSPPPNMGSRGRENGGWREERGGHMFERGGRRDRGRFHDYSRPPPPSASGPNSVPIGNHRKQPVGNEGTSGLAVRMPIGLSVPEMVETNQRQARGGGGMRGGAGASSHPHRGVQYDRGYGIDHVNRFRSGKFESDGPPTRRDNSHPPFDKQLETGVSQGDHFSPSTRDALYEPALPDPARLARTWTPRGEAPPQVFMGSSGTNMNDRHATSPSISKALPPFLDTGRPHNRDRPGSSRGRPPPIPHQADRFSRQPNESRRGLEGRLSDRFDDSASLHQSRVFPQVTDQSNYSVNGSGFGMHSSDPPTRAESRKSLPEFRDLPFSKRVSDKDTKVHERHQQESFHYSSQSYVPHESDMSHRNRDVDVLVDGPLQPHSNVDRDEHTGRNRHLDNRPEMARRPGSLLERLEMGNDDNIGQEEPSLSRSLSDRVQVPSKRERDDIDRFVADDAFGYDDRKPTPKRPRRKGKNLKMGQS